MTDWAKDQALFMTAGDQTVHQFNRSQAERYLAHIAEEAAETQLAWKRGDLTGALDGAVDTIVVAIGMIHSMGIDPNQAWDAVFAANSRKIIDGKVYRRDDGQIGKPPGWYGPEIELERFVVDCLNDSPADGAVGYES